MDDLIVKRLNAINREFYRATAANFDQTRGNAWPGWERLLPHVDKLPRAFSVLDVGCGNGRFGVFVREHFGSEIHYHGVDNNAALLTAAKASLPDAVFEEQDVVENPPDTGSYTLVALFGVMHHIPGADRRLEMMRALAERVAPGGLLVFTCWRFYEIERLRQRIIPWPDDLTGQVESGDYLLDWRRGVTALRYCHYVNDAEHQTLVAASELEALQTYRADGYTDADNLYSILRKPD
jgi:tRNA (uracil-5-)-methyltransferase TRM9